MQESRSKMYEVDWEKVKTLQDIKSILQAIEFTFTGYLPGLKDIQHLLREKEGTV
jgi:hypothetical protein